MKRYFYYSIQVVLLLIVFMACKKLANDSLDVVPVVKAPLSVSVINDDDQLPVAGVKVIISRKISSKGDFIRVDTIRTNAQGQLSLELPYPNYLKIEVDTTYYHIAAQELEFLNESGGKVTLHTTPKYGMSPLDIIVNDKTANTPLANIPLYIGTRAPGVADFTSTGPENADANGKLMVSLPYPNEVRIAIADTMKYFPDTAVANLKNVRGAAVILKTELKPITVPLEVTVLDKDNNTPLAGVEIAVLQKLTGEDDFKDIGLLSSTAANGKITFNAPFSGEVKIQTNDEVYYFSASVITRMAYEKNRKITLLSKLLNPETPVELSVFSTEYGVNNKRGAFGTDVKISYRKTGQTTFTLLKTDKIASNGKITLNIPLAAEFKFEVTGDKIFADKVLNYTNSGVTAKQIDLSLILLPPKYPEPILTSLEVGTLNFNNSLSVNKPQDIVTDKFGNRYITEGSGNRILRVDRFDNTTVLAGTGTAGSVDGDGAVAQFYGPWGLAIDKEGNLYTVDNTVATGSHKVRKITIDANYKATVSTLAGSGTAGGTNGVGTAASFNRPSGLCYDENRNCLYVAEWSGHRVRKIDLATRTVSLIAGSGTGAAISAGTGAAAVFNFPWGVELSADGAYLYVSSWSGNGLSKVKLSDNSVTVLGTGKTNMSQPRGLYVSPANQVFISNTGGHYISRILAEVAGNASTFTKVTGGSATGYRDGAAATAQFAGPVGIHYDPYTGIFYVADGDGTNQKVRTMKSSTIN